MANLQIDAITMSEGGTRLEHITHVYGPAFPVMTRGAAVRSIVTGEHTFHVASNDGLQIGGSVPVRVVHPALGLSSLTIPTAPYLRTAANDTPNDNLLRLPRR